MIPKRTKDTDISSEIAQGKHFQKRLRASAEEATGRFLQGETLNFAVSDISKRENFNQLQIQRLVEETNVLAFNKRYDERKKESDRRITFELAELNGVLEEMGSEAPKAIENPNWIKGKSGEGEITKSASVMRHTLNSQTDDSRKRLADKQAKAKTELLEKEAKALSRDIESGIFKIANSLVHTEKTYKNANTVFNTMLSGVSFDDSIAEGIMKKASEITEYMKNSGRLREGFMLSLEVKPEEKVASTLFGSHSLLKTANTNQLVEEPKVAPIQNIGDFQQLISLAKDIQHKQQASLKVENEIHNGGAPSVK